MRRKKVKEPIVNKESAERVLIKPSPNDMVAWSKENKKRNLLRKFGDTNESE